MEPDPRAEPAAGVAVWGGTVPEQVRGAIASVPVAEKERPISRERPVLV